MSAHFADRLAAAIADRECPVCLGLDPRFAWLPRCLRESAGRAGSPSEPDPRAAARAIGEFGRALIDGLADVVPACKFQIAFYEALGADGIRTLEETVARAKAKGLIVISDAKRGDIESTAEAYARAHLGATSPDADAWTGLDADALTVSPFPGMDTLAPYLAYCRTAGKGLFVLVKTSNPGSADFQDLDVCGEPLYQHIARKLQPLAERYRGHSGLSSIGAVVGATYPEHARRVRQVLPDSFFLVPGIGPQGGTAEAAAAAFRDDGRGALVSASRAVLYAFRDEPYATRFGEDGFVKASREAVLNLAQQVRHALRGRP